MATDPLWVFENYGAAAELIDELEKQTQWISVDEQLPESERTVLAYYLNSHGKERKIRAEHVARWTVEAGMFADPDIECVEYSEKYDEYYLLEGWYECIDNWDEYSRIAVVEGKVTHWLPLPSAPTP